MGTPSSFTSTSRFRILLDPEDADVPGIDIVLVPGIGSSSPENWPFGSRAWLNTLPSNGAGIRTLAYEYASPFTSSQSSWESMLMLGYDLLDNLCDTLALSEDPEVVSGSGLQPLALQSPTYLHSTRASSLRSPNKPIILVCHSLGGIIVKQALCIASKQIQRYGSTINTIAGVIFLSTPHRVGDKAATLARFRDILEITSGRALRISSTQVEQQGALLIDLADRFEGIFFRTPILSAYELRETKTNSSSLRSKQQQLVDREACSTNAPMETVVGLNLNHHDTCLTTKSNGSEGLPMLNKFIHDTIRDSRDLVALRFRDQEYQYATMSAYSPTMSELPLKVRSLELTEYPSNGATEGTSLAEFEMVHPATEYGGISKRLNLPCCMLSAHSTNDDFCGREDVLKRIATELLPPDNMVTSTGTGLRQFALCGFGGIGKTEIAREFARRHKDSFDAVFWVVADEVAKLDQDYQRISLALGLEEPSDCKSQVVSREIVKGWLSNPQQHLSGSDEVAQPGQARSEQSWLLVFDNADDPIILADYWPQGSGSILLTSRDPLAKSIFTREPSGMDLGPLTQQESLSLFNNLTTAFDDPEDKTAQEISDAIGGVPLAISQMAGIIRRQDLTLEEFLELYKDHEEHASLYETKFDTNLVTYKHSLSTVWAFEKLKPQARQLLELISFLDPDIIGEDLLVQASTELLSIDGAPFKKSQYLDARADLLQSSLIQRNKPNQQISVHRIVQDAILATMHVVMKRDMFGQIVRVLWAGWPSAMPKPSREPQLPQPKSSGGRLHVGRWPVCGAIYPHVLKLHQLWETISEPSEVTSLNFAKLLSEAAWYQKERGRRKSFDGFFETALKICDASQHPDRDALLADIYFCLGSIAMDSNEFEASGVNKERSLELCSKICDELNIKDERLSLAYSELGISRIQDERYEEGEAALKESISIRKALGNYVPRSGEASLSFSLMAQGKFDECDTLLLESLAGREKALGKDDKESARTGLILYALGNLRAAQEAWPESLEFHERAWRHMRATVGDKDQYTANVMHKMAEHLHRQGQGENAIDMINAALSIWAIDPSAHKNEIARTTFFKAKLFESTGKSHKATIALKVAARLRKEITGEDRDAKTLTTSDFDKLVAFWAR